MEKFISSPKITILVIQMQRLIGQHAADLDQMGKMQRIAAGLMEQSILWKRVGSKAVVIYDTSGNW